MNYSLLPDTEILKDLGRRFDASRIQKELTDQELAQRSGLSTVTISKFKAGNNISLISLIRLLRAIDELDLLEKILPKDSAWHPTMQKQKPPKQRVRKSNKKHGFKWGDEQ